jgi:threonine dehydrogenase-like Zn-dependent dehydrogenase
MKAWRLHDWGDMRLDEVPEPAPPPGWVKLRIRVVQPSITETLLFRGHRTYGRGLIEKALAAGPFQAFGHEFSGEVVEVGAGVAALRRGDRVAARGSHPDGIVGFDYPGAFAEYGVFPESLLAVLPDHVSDGEGAAIQPLSDAVAAVHAAGIRLGDVVAVIGQGSMGLASLQTARAAGAGLVIAVARREAVLAVSRSVGADVAIDASRDDPVAEVLALTGCSRPRADRRSRGLRATRRCCRRRGWCARAVRSSASPSTARRLCCPMRCSAPGRSATCSPRCSTGGCSRPRCDWSLRDASTSSR